MFRDCVLTICLYSRDSCTVIGGGKIIYLVAKYITQKVGNIKGDGGGVAHYRVCYLNGKAWRRVDIDGDGGVNAMVTERGAAVS